MLFFYKTKTLLKFLCKIRIINKSNVKNIQSRRVIPKKKMNKLKRKRHVVSTYRCKTFPNYIKIDESRQHKQGKLLQKLDNMCMAGR